jgi:hypothetical protein
VSGLPVRAGEFRILDFDIENRPLSYWVPDRPTAEVTAIAAGWADRPENVKVWLLRPASTEADHRAQMRQMLDEFAAMYAVADMVTGHYIRRHDLPIIQAHMVEWGLPLLGPKLAQDTKLDLVGFSDIPKTQEHLSNLMELAEEKHHMTQSMWRTANRLTAEGLLQTEKRVADDVRQHMELRLALLDHHLLRSPKVWR